MIGSTLGGRIERRWIFYGLACLCLLMFSIDMTIVSVALRTIVEDLARRVEAIEGQIARSGSRQQGE